MESRGQSETIGVVLLLGITVLGMGVVVAVGTGALDTAQQSSAVDRAAQSMSLLDARSALVALGRADSQSVSLAGSSDGSYEVRPDTGRITVSRVTNNTTQGPLVNTTLGSVVYENGQQSVAYQGGGVWRSYDGGSTMVSPPEFNYQDATLTLPVIRVAGGASSVAGEPTANIRPNAAKTNLSVFPSSQNPLSNGTVVVTVHSEYYRGWANYFEQRTQGNVTVNHDEKSVALELVARGSGGEFRLTESPIQLRGMAGDSPIQSLEFTLESGKGSKFSDLDWSLVADSGGSKRFEFNVAGGNPCKNNPKLPTVTLTYENGTTTHTWQNQSTFTADGSTYSYSCSGPKGETPTFHLDLTNDTSLPYEGASPPLGNDSTGYLVNEYLERMGPNVDLAIETKTGKKAPGNSASVDLDTSTGALEYSSSDERVVTFLHVTRNTVNVTLT
jgi:hypothetical protein